MSDSPYSDSVSYITTPLSGTINIKQLNQISACFLHYTNANFNNQEKNSSTLILITKIN